MISVCSDSIGAFLSKGEPQKDSSAQWPTWLTPKLAGAIFLGLAAFTGTLLAYIWQGSVKDMDEFYSELKTVNVSISKLTESVARIDERTKSLERTIWKAKARSVGFNNPHIVLAALTPNERFEATISGKMGEEYFFKYRIVSYDAASHALQFAVDAELPKHVTIKDVLIDITAKPGQMVDLSRPLGGIGLPKIYLQIIDMPARNEAVLAIGSKTEPGGKPS